MEGDVYIAYLAVIFMDSVQLRKDANSFIKPGKSLKRNICNKTYALLVSTWAMLLSVTGQLSSGVNTAHEWRSIGESQKTETTSAHDPQHYPQQTEASRMIILENVHSTSLSLISSHWGGHECCPTFIPALKEGCPVFLLYFLNLAVLHLIVGKSALYILRVYQTFTTVTKLFSLFHDCYGL